MKVNGADYMKMFSDPNGAALRKSLVGSHFLISNHCGTNSHKYLISILLKTVYQMRTRLPQALNSLFSRENRLKQRHSSLTPFLIWLLSPL